jgi:predicted outer membrane repeat protein
MENWQSVLKEIPEKWLLEEENPSVRYFMLKDILGNGVENSEMERAKELIMQRGIVPEILKKQEEQDYLQTFSKFYTNKYEGLVWQLIALAECGATLNIQIREHCEYIFNNSQEISEGGFSQNSSKTKGGGLFSEVIPCLTGNMAWCLIRFGYFEDYRLQKAINWITKNMIFLDGERFAPAVPPYKGYDMCWGRHTCFMGAVKTLKALAEIPEQKRTPEVTKTIKEAVEFMLLHRVNRQSHNLNKAAKPGWLKFGFPLMYQKRKIAFISKQKQINEPEFLFPVHFFYKIKKSFRLSVTFYLFWESILYKEIMEKDK